MSTAIFLITLVAFIGRIVVSAIALRSWLTVTALSIVALSICILPGRFGISIDDPIERLHSSLGLMLVLLFCALLFAIGYGVPALLAYAERSRRWMRLAFLVAVVATISAADLWMLQGRLGLVEPYIIPSTWFTVGTGWYLVIKARFFEDSGDAPQLERRRL